MTMRIATFSNDGEGGTKLGHETVELRAGLSDFLATSPMMSSAEPCKRYFYTELPSGYVSSKDFSSRRQLCVLLSGEVELTSSAGHVERFNAGAVIRLEDTDYENPGRAIRVIGDQAARILSVQVE
ncbi:hypothetical protein RAZWK3B_08616 [Roseobacter sp. AzwK-3b]|uniref:hypothetical protein n=1 Tax=Roseobacter sp. AzwK-3b TaxID=351016 RepID=UPI00015691EE|nr:hypothetical protein [Roseobacter sp. AzwK-3b]EDM72299.1 hypothetical protein RAZWK3B_08616 [Roseobacter sp. AzwK-3b]